MGDRMSFNIKETVCNIALGLSGISYVLTMKHDDYKQKIKGFTTPITKQDYSIHVRDRQPCWGELRKYEDSHKGECTQPKNKKPTDLYHKFPEGIPFSLSVKVNTPSKEMNEFLSALYDPKESPFRLGFNEVEFVTNPDKLITVLHFPDMNLDPTVLVKSLKMINTKMTNTGFEILYCKYIKYGFTPTESLFLLYTQANLDVTLGVSAHTNRSISLRRFFEGIPHDLTGGTLKDRVDYNRTELDEVFRGSVNFGQYCKGKGLRTFGYDSGKSDLSIVPKVQLIIKELLSLESKPTRELFIWRTTLGKTNKPDSKVAKAA